MVSPGMKLSGCWRNSNKYGNVRFSHFEGLSSMVYRGGGGGGGQQLGNADLALGNFKKTFMQDLDSVFGKNQDQWNDDVYATKRQKAWADTKKKSKKPVPTLPVIVFVLDNLGIH